MASLSSEVRPASVSKSGRAKRGSDSTDAKKCYPWMTRNGEKIQISTPQPFRRADLASYKFLNFATILGPPRQGKSFLMNCLIGDNVFRTADTISVCTKGIQVASVVHDVKNGGGAFFVDTGDEIVDSDTILLTPIIMLSKVILFNWKGGPLKKQILNELATLVEIGNCVSNSVENDTSKFGHLHILLRDFHFQGTAQEAFAMIFDEENSRAAHVKKRNMVRKKVLSSFESVNVSIFPAPCQDVHNLNSNTTSQKFKKKVKELKDTILDQMSQPRSFGTVVVHFQNVNVLVKKFVEVLEKKDIIFVKSVVRQLQGGVVDEAKRCFKESLIKAYKKIDLPRKDGLEELLSQERNALLDVFAQNTANVDVQAVYKNDVLEDLENFADREFDAKRKENLLAIQSKEMEQNEILVTAVEEFRSTIENELKRSEEGSEQMRQRFQSKMVSNFLEMTKELNWIPEIVEKELKKLEQWYSAMLDEKVKSKQIEERNCLSRAVDDFRLGVENALQKSENWSASNLIQAFQQEIERLIGIYQNDTGGIVLISQQREAELEKLKVWAEAKFKEKIQAASEAERLWWRNPELSREQARLLNAQERSFLPLTRPQLFVYDQHSSPSFSLAQSDNHNTLPSSPFGFETPPSSPFSSVNPPLSANIPATIPSTDELKFYKGGQFTPGGGRAPAGGCYISPGPGSNSKSPGSSSEAKFYKGGQFTPGGGRAPAGGFTISPGPGSSSRSPGSSSEAKFYKGGQFTPGGGRAPAGGCHISLGLASSSRSSGSKSGGTFYKGGQFLPGGGRAPKGGCRR